MINQKKGQPRQLREIFPGRNKDGEATVRNQQKGTHVHGDKTNKIGVLPWLCPCPTRFFVFLLQISKWNLCEKLWKEKKNCCSAWNVHYRLAMNTQNGQKREQATGAVCSPSVWKEKLYSEQFKRYNLSWSHHCGRATRQRLGQHWFITAYIVVNIQGLFTVYNGAGVWGTVAVLVWPGTGGVGSLYKFKVQYPCKRNLAQLLLIEIFKFCFEQFFVFYVGFFLK